MRPGEDPLAELPPAALRPWPAAAFRRPTDAVARALLGAYLVAGPTVARIVETEAYVTGDPASHAFRGPTPRNRSMFGPPGHWYVFRIHRVDCANVVTRRGEAVLLRAATVVSGPPRNLSGPGRLARGLGVGPSFDGRPVRDGPVRLARGVPPPERVLRGPRIGISRGTERPLRFWLDGVREVSRPRGAATGASPSRTSGDGR